jgi:curved DNA-binding protein
LAFKDYYQALGVDKKASQDDVQRAYKKLARKLHPDVNKEPGAEDRFKELGEAYEVLRDPEKRSKYDRFGHAWKQAEQRTGGAPPGWENVRVEYGPGFERDFGVGGGGFGGGGGGFEGGDSEAFRSLFEELFGGGGGPFGGAGPRGGGFHTAGRRSPARRGADNEAELEITLEEAARGGKRKITLADPTSGEHQTLEVNVPPGIRTGKKLRLSGQGSAGHGGAPRGDLLLKVKLRPHPRFRLRGEDLHVDLKVAPWEAALGSEVEVPTLDGEQRVKIPAGTSSGAKIRLRGKGFPSTDGKAGDLFAEVSIVVPKELGERERELYEELAKASSLRPSD